MTELVNQYRNLPLGSVDVSVVATAERLDVAQLATLDRSLSVMGPGPPMVSNYFPSHIDRSLLGIDYPEACLLCVGRSF